MSLSVKDIVQLPIMKTSKVRTGKEWLKSRMVEWISVIEVPVENFVRKNEFVLSTGIGCEGDNLLLEKFVNDIIDSGASVLAFATGRYINDIPDRVIELANKHHLVLIEIPWEVRFGEILQIVLEEIHKEKQGERQQAEDVRQELINCVLHEKGLEDISSILYKHINMPIAIIDHSGQLRANKKFNEELLAVFNGEKKGTVQQIPSSDVLYSEHPLFHQMKEYLVHNHIFFLLPIVNNHHNQGSLLFHPVDREKLTTFVMNVLDHSLTACALYFVKENAVELTEVRLKDNFILELAQKYSEVTTQLISKAQLLGYDLARPYLCLVGEMTHNDRKKTLKVQGESLGSSSLQSRNYYLQKEITRAGKNLRRRTMTTFDEDEVIIFLEADNQPYMETANQFLDNIEERLYELLSHITFSWGIATHKDGHYAFHNSYEEAKTALKIGKQQKGLGERTFFSDTRINRLLMAISQEDAIATIVKDTLQPLLDYDEKRQTDLIYTFIIYNKYKGNVSQTARALNLHRQSLLHRLRNIESLTGLSLVDSDDLFLLELSVRLWMLKKFS
ncbi:PucR family transcriptional regulator [Evansella cellulosilytica]|uniref:Transcriptional regulator, PucR family n=1 Tax=Evansella cellulosilytica (strain ATCC 21833 / DSM 2522 / FERM P-1141 / JCM 9156 / N-4) TaxID=649639 RepID=E6U1V6_EVAC2|nr:PucR family transcriptional regulator [Evansella cellulosilytica]ADU31603.1 transcriptional regulator, PucR family [Evansella cellulosilytica DSM 2522]